eukprot:680840-Pleurochrysis_carterae.AAC.1
MGSDCMFVLSCDVPSLRLTFLSLPDYSCGVSTYNLKLAVRQGGDTGVKEGLGRYCSKLATRRPFKLSSVNLANCP